MKHTIITFALLLTHSLIAQDYDVLGTKITLTEEKQSVADIIGCHEGTYYTAENNLGELFGRAPSLKVELSKFDSDSRAMQKSSEVVISENLSYEISPTFKVTAQGITMLYAYHDDENIHLIFKKFDLNDFTEILSKNVLTIQRKGRGSESDIEILTEFQKSDDFVLRTYDEIKNVHSIVLVNSNGELETSQELLLEPGYNWLKFQGVAVSPDHLCCIVKYTSLEKGVRTKGDLARAYYFNRKEGTSKLFEIQTKERNTTLANFKWTVTNNNQLHIAGYSFGSPEDNLPIHNMFSLKYDLNTETLLNENYIDLPGTKSIDNYDAANPNPGWMRTHFLQENENGSLLFISSHRHYTRQRLSDGGELLRYYYKSITTAMINSQGEFTDTTIISRNHRVTNIINDGEFFLFVNDTEVKLLFTSDDSIKLARIDRNNFEVRCEPSGIKGNKQPLRKKVICTEGPTPCQIDKATYLFEVQSKLGPAHSEIMVNFE